MSPAFALFQNICFIWNSTSTETFLHDTRDCSPLMTARFDVFYETTTLRETIEPMLSLIPPYFDLRPCEGPCVLHYHSHPNWCDFPFPVAKYTVYIFCDDGKNLKYVGGNYGGAVSVKILSCETRSPKVIAQRIWHELLHAVGQPADDMLDYAPEWTKSKLIFILFRLCAMLGLENNTYFHGQYYLWLTKRAEQLTP